VTQLVKNQALKAKQASFELASLKSQVKDDALNRAADLLEKQSKGILKENEKDLANAKGLTKTALDRLRLDEKRIESMVVALREIATLTDPIGEVVDGWVRPNGIKVSRIRVPLGVIGIVYENRPNVTSDAAGLCLKSSNATLLRGSSSAQNSNLAIVKVLRQALEETGVNPDAITLIEDTSYEAVKEMLGLKGIIDCVIPRGGPSLVSTVIENAKVPVIIDGDGNCHTYVDQSADIEMALKIVKNAKMQRPSVCNATETLVVHKKIAKKFLPLIQKELKGVEFVGDKVAQKLMPGIAQATPQDWATEFLDLKLAVKVVDSLDDAIEHIRKYSTGHSEAIITKDLISAQRFINEVDAAAVLVNTSTRLVDGSELGLGAEIGISTQKLHARGPMGLRELTSVKFVIEGNGQIRT
jgi:glutamate-5-semialdehyde dehydrogenase